MGDTNTQNAQLAAILAAGVPQSYIDANPQFKNGSWIDPQDTPKYITGYQSSSSNAYSFDPNKFLPDIQKQADNIYNPQKAQIAALQGIQSAQTAQNRITTQKDFDKQLQSEIEAINARGAFFSGGALNRQSEIGTAKTTALTNITLQDMAAQSGLLGQLAGLSAAQVEYIQSKLTGAENSAYTRFTDQRNYALQVAQNAQAQSNWEKEYKLLKKKKK